MTIKKLPEITVDAFSWDEAGSGIIHGPHNFVIAPKSAQECNARMSRSIYTGPQICVLLNGASIQTCGPVGEPDSVQRAKEWIVSHMRSVANVYTGRPFGE